MESSDTQKTASKIINTLRTNYHTHKGFAAGALVIVAGIYYLEKSPNISKIQHAPAAIASSDISALSSFPIIAPTIKWGFALDTFQTEEKQIKVGQSLSEILAAQVGKGVSVAGLIEQVKKNLKNADWEAGRMYTTLSKDGIVRHLIYEPDPFRYFVFDFENGKQIVTEVVRPVEVKERIVAGVVKGTLWETMIANGLPFEIIDEMSDALKYAVDFHHTVEGDEFRLIFEEKIIDGKVAGVGKLRAASYRKQGDEDKENLVFWVDGTVKGYVTKEGKPLKGSGFLRSPLKFSRITSPFSKSRMHPVLHTMRAHTGTDYAAPHGTPILAVADGVVLEARNSGGGGNMVRLKHNGTYQTQYLHMSRFASGTRSGAKVKQGQVIGYVGSTGWATGPHVCFRLYKNGTAVNHLKEKLPILTTMSSAQMTSFKAQRDELMKRMETQPFLTPEQMAANKKIQDEGVKP